ncbi:glycosyltransferase [Haloparvum sp. AD34]
MITSEELPDSLSGCDGPRVAVVLATYNPEKSIRESIQSVVDQSYGNIELITVDGSNEVWLKKLSSELSWLTYVSQDGEGVANAWNEGIDVADCEYISFLADDDYYGPTKIKRQVEFLKESKADIVYSDEYIINQNGDVNVVSGLDITDPQEHYIEYFRRGQGVPHLTVMGRKACFERHRFDESLDAREDPHLWVRIFKDFTPGYIPEPLAYKRRRDESLTADPEMMFRNELQEINDLVNRYDELVPLKTERKTWAKYRYGRNLLNRGRNEEARRVFIGIVENDITHFRGIAMLLAAVLPIQNSRVISFFEKVSYSIESAF